MQFDSWRPYIRIAQRRHSAALETLELAKNGRAITPVVIDGRKIARTFWGKAWCDNLERYSDYSNRLPRGRTYVRNGSVVHLELTPGEARALVSGSSLYRVEVKVAAVPKKRWSAICADCATGIDSLVELLQGRFSQAVMERICREQTGLFPAPSEMEFSCSCPDWASMCKHVAAVLYGVGARLDREPHLLFALRRVAEKDLLAKAGTELPGSTQRPGRSRVLESTALSDVFGLEMATAEDAPSPDSAARTSVKRTRSRRSAERAAATEAEPKAVPARTRTRKLSAISKRKVLERAARKASAKRRTQP